MKKFLVLVAIFLVLPWFLIATSSNPSAPNAQLGAGMMGLGVVVLVFAVLAFLGRGLFGTHQRFHKRMKTRGLW